MKTSLAENAESAGNKNHKNAGRQSIEMFRPPELGAPMTDCERTAHADILSIRATERL